MWYSLRIGNFKAKISPIKKVEENNFKDVDENGKPLEWVKGKVERGHFINENNEIVKKGYKLINDKVCDKFEKTKEVSIYKEVDVEEIDDLMKENYYYVECDDLKEQLKDSGKALKFAFSNGNGFKLYYAYITLFGNALIMYLGSGFISQQILNIEEESISKKALEELKGVVVNKAKVEDLLKI